MRPFLFPNSIVTRVQVQVTRKVIGLPALKGTIRYRAGELCVFGFGWVLFVIAGFERVIDLTFAVKGIAG